MTILIVSLFFFCFVLLKNLKLLLTYLINADLTEEFSIPSKTMGWQLPQLPNNVRRVGVNNSQEKNQTLFLHVVDKVEQEMGFTNKRERAQKRTKGNGNH